jgi:hypothetical protein
MTTFAKDFRFSGGELSLNGNPFGTLHDAWWTEIGDGIPYWRDVTIGGSLDADAPLDVVGKDGVWSLHVTNAGKITFRGFARLVRGRQIEIKQSGDVTYEP